MRTVYIWTLYAGQCGFELERGYFMMAVAPDAREGAGTSSIPPALEGFFGIAEKWNLTTDEQIKLLGSPGRSTFFKWKKEGGSIPKDTVERISHLLAIFKALEILLPDTRAADSWVRQDNEYFNGKSALDIMLDGQFVDLLRVRQYVDAQRGG
jgi:hypothetical protein